MSTEIAELEHIEAQIAPVEAFGAAIGLDPELVTDRLRRLWQELSDGESTLSRCVCEPTTLTMHQVCQIRKAIWQPDFEAPWIAAGACQRLLAFAVAKFTGEDAPAQCHLEYVGQRMADEINQWERTYEKRIKADKQATRRQAARRQAAEAAQAGAEPTTAVEAAQADAEPITAKQSDELCRLKALPYYHRAALARRRPGQGAIGSPGRTQRALRPS